MSNNCHSTRQAFWFAGLGVLLYWPTHCSADQADLLSLVRAGQRSAGESIRSFSAAVTNEITFSKRPPIVLAGHYWRSLDVVRAQEKQGDGTDDYLFKDSEIRQVGRGVEPQRKEIRYAAMRRAASEILCVLDVWRLMMLDFAGPNGRCDFDGLLESVKGSPKVKREKKDGHNCIRVDLSYSYGSGDESSNTMWFDVDHNYLVWKTISTSKDSSDSGEAEILEFSEPTPGVFTPMKMRQQTFHNGERTTLSMVALSDVQVNKPIPESVLQLPAIPSGTILDDRIQRTKYPIDSNWRPVGPASPLPQATEIAGSVSPSTEFHSQSTTEPVLFSRWLISASLVVLIIACTFLVYRQLRLRNGI